MSTFLMISVHLLSKFHTYINKHVSALSLDSCVDFSSTGIQGQTMFFPAMSDLQTLADEILQIEP